MNRTLYIVACILSGTALIIATPAARAATIDVEAAKSLFDDNECSKCHSVDKTKKGPPLKKISQKYKGKADAEAALLKHLKSGVKVKLEDGSQEDHKIIEAKDDGQIKNLIHWILSL
jgi:cytochrome c